MIGAAPMEDSNVNLEISAKNADNALVRLPIRICGRGETHGVAYQA